MNNKITTMPDENLYNLCKTYGERTRIWRQRFAGLLPEVFKRKLYQKKGFYSIFEFAKKLAGMSEEQVRLTINLEKRFERTPALKSLLTTGKVSINKLSKIVSIAKPENEIFLATQVQILSKSAVETLVRDEKFADINFSDFSGQNGLFEAKIDPKVVPGQMHFDIKNTKSNQSKIVEKPLANFTSKTLNLSEEVTQKLLALQQKGLDINAIILESLQNREEEIAQKKEEISQELVRREQEKQIKNLAKNTFVNSSGKITTSPKTPQTSPSRHIPISIKRIIYAEHGTKCSAPNCQKSSEQIHHVHRFSAVRSHDPLYLAPLCKAHHELMHCKDLDYVEIRKKAC
ncbi:MAG: HNH endonuclease signature motif containing protein [Candidatus Peregrinibacteria bacterium]|nr:HNH endonuclease signature motif containing protein [Candidatus Peregrinibacteria bacterium]